MFDYHFTWRPQMVAGGGWFYAEAEIDAKAAVTPVIEDGVFAGFSVGTVELRVMRYKTNSIGLDHKWMPLVEADPMRQQIVTWLTAQRADDVRAAWEDESPDDQPVDNTTAKHRPSAAQMGVS